MERTLVILKPDTVQRGLVGEIITRFEKVGLKIVGMKMTQPGEAHYHHHYEGISKMATRRGEMALNVTVELMQSGPVIAMVLEGIESVEIVRKMIGDTEPKKALPGTIRGDYSHVSLAHANAREIGIANIVHASGNLDEAKQEIKHWFSDDELFEYRAAHEQFTQPGGRK